MYNKQNYKIEEKFKGHSRANNREPQGHNLSNFGRGPFDDQSAS